MLLKFLIVINIFNAAELGCMKRSIQAFQLRHVSDVRYDNTHSNMHSWIPHIPERRSGCCSSLSLYWPPGRGELVHSYPEWQRHECVDKDLNIIVFDLICFLKSWKNKTLYNLDMIWFIRDKYCVAYNYEPAVQCDSCCQRQHHKQPLITSKRNLSASVSTV